MKKTTMKILMLYSMTFTLNNSFAGVCECESWKLGMIKTKSDIELVLGEEIDLDKTFTKIPELLDSKSTIIMSHIDVKGYKLDVFMNKNKEVNILNEHFNGNMVHYENKEFTMNGSIYDKKYLDVIDIEDIKILSKDMGHHKDYITAIENTDEHQLYHDMFTNKFSEINCEKLKNWYSMAYLMNNKLSISLLKSDWFYISNNNYKLIISYTKFNNQIELHYFTEKDSINLLFIYKNPINEADFYRWLNKQ